MSYSLIAIATSASHRSMKAPMAFRRWICSVANWCAIETTPSAYTYPLLIKSLLHTALINAPDQEIVYADRVRHDYRTFRQRVGRLAGALTELGIRRGTRWVLLGQDNHASRAALRNAI